MLAEVEALDFGSAGETRRPIAASSTLRITNVATMAKTQVISDGDDLGGQHASRLPAGPSGLPSANAPVARVAKTPVRIAPSVPPTP